MVSITVLDSKTIDKIAAGEVVERPTSVIKELVENAIDAKATGITVEIKEGGLSFIRVTDNGSGIGKTQVQKAFLRHATSKIKKVEDLFHMTSLGFRGEALSSISSVSQVELISKTEEELVGIRYCIEGGVEVSLEEVGVPNGTTFLVRNLFYNTPVRRNFLKSAGVEGGQIADLMEHLALSKPNISFTYINNNKTKFHTSGNGDLNEVIYRIFGREIVKELVPIKIKNKLLDVQGYLGKPSINRGSRNFENYFVNDRYLKNDMISKAIEEGYKSYMMTNKYPFCVLHFTVEPHLIDVNVHPTKMDIRFTNHATFHQEIVTAIIETLKTQELVPEITLVTEQEKKEEKRIENITKEPIKAPEPFEENRIISNKVHEEMKYSDNREKINKLQDNLQKDLKTQGNCDKYREKTFENEILRATQNEIIQPIIVNMKEEIVQLELFEDKFLSKNAKEQYCILGQIFNTYWIVSFSDKIFLIDQHAAHEKVNYERLIIKIQNNLVETQMINPPIIVTLTAKEATTYEEYASYFENMGFEIEEFGGNEYAIRSVPTELFGSSEKELFEEVIDELTVGNIKGTPKVIEKKIASMSCKAAIKGNKEYTTKEIEFLLDELLTLDNPYYCPHGRPTIVSMSKYEIEKKFKRII